MPRLSQPQKEFRELHIKPFLQDNTANEFLNNKTLMEKFCELFNFNKRQINTANSSEKKKALAYLSQVKHAILHPELMISKKKEIVGKVKIEKTKKIIIKKRQQEKKDPLNLNPIEIDEITETQTELKRIKEIKFSSTITQSTIKRIEAQSKTTNHLLNDYIYFLNGGTEEEEEIKIEEINGNQRNFKIIKRKRFQFESLKLMREIKHNILNLENNWKELSAMEQKLRILQKIDASPIDFFNNIAEGGFNIQKELQGAILNDKAMVDNGIVILEPQVKEITPDLIEETAKDVIKYADDERFKDILEKMES